MTRLPKQPKLYHIAHVDNLRAISRDGELVADREIERRGGPKQAIGMSDIKRRRFPFALVERIGVRSARTWHRASTALAGADHKPVIEKRPDWYF